MNSAEPAQYFSRPTHPHQKDSQFAIRTGRKERNAYVSHFGQSAHSRTGTEIRRADQGVFFACMYDLHA